jgi:hypothetical protein
VTAGGDDLAKNCYIFKVASKEGGLSHRNLTFRTTKEMDGDGAGSSMTFYTLPILSQSRGPKNYLRLHSGKIGPMQSCINVIMKVNLGLQPCEQENGQNVGLKMIDRA